MCRVRCAKSGVDGLRDTPRRDRPTAPIVRAREECAELQRHVCHGTISLHLAMRARIVFRYGDGLLDQVVAAQVGVDSITVSPWRKRFAERRLYGLIVLERTGGPRKFVDEIIAD